MRSGRLCSRQIPENEITVAFPESNFRTELVAETQGVAGERNADGAFLRRVSRFFDPHGHGHVTI